MKTFKSNGYLQSGYKLWKTIFLFVGRKHCPGEYTFGLKIGSRMDTEHYCSREVSFHFWTYRIGMWLEDTK
jgi:hypothetical protein